MDPPTILAAKQAFLSRAVRQLGKPVAPSRAWHHRNGTDRDARAAARLPPRTVDDVLARVNHRLRQHARRVYAPAAMRHVAEQIDQLYGEEDLLGGAAHRPASTDDLQPPPDYTDPAVLDALPAAWADHDIPTAAAAAAAMPLEARRYTEHVARLRDLAAQRAAAARRVQQLRRLAAAAAPFGSASAGDDGGRRLQDGLVTRDGAVEAELERMRVLLARVGDRVAALAATTTTTTATQDNVQDVEVVGRKRVQALLALP